LCKVAGAGITAGDQFAFSLTTQGVARTVSVAAGSCTSLLVGTRADAQTQGFFANHLSAIGAFVPGGARLTIDSAQLTAAQIQEILTSTAGKPNGVTASSNLLLTLAQQLLVADLNVLSGAIAPAPVLTAMGQANAGLQIAVNGNAIVLSTPLSKAEMSALITTLTAFNEGKLGGPGSGSTSIRIVETPATNTKVSAIACTPRGACADLDLIGAAVTATVSTGATTEASFTNTSTVGKLKVCKVAGTGITAGTPFTFTVTVGRPPRNEALTSQAA